MRLAQVTYLVTRPAQKAIDESASTCVLHFLLGNSLNVTASLSDILISQFSLSVWACMMQIFKHDDYIRVVECFLAYKEAMKCPLKMTHDHIMIMPG